jgi:hypothetical protein
MIHNKKVLKVYNLFRDLHKFDKINKNRKKTNILLRLQILELESRTKASYTDVKLTFKNFKNIIKIGILQENINFQFSRLKLYWI